MAQVTASPLIDMAMPEWQWREYHERRIAAPLQLVWDAALSATMGELVITRPLMALRGLGAGLARERPIFEAMPPRQIAADPPRELLLGLIFPTHGKLRDVTQPNSIATLNAALAPGLVRQAVNLRLQEFAGGTLVSTETRAIANDAAARRRFAFYWTLIRPASGLIRRDTLRAIARRAEASAAKFA